MYFRMKDYKGEIMKKERIHLLDTVRGILILGVVIYHFLFDVAVFTDIDMTWFDDWWVNLIRDIGAGTFIFISGISCHLSHNNMKRGIKAAIVAILISVVTYFFVPDEFILFGIIHLLALCMLLYEPVLRIFNRVPAAFGALMALSCYLLTSNVYYGYIGIAGFLEIHLPLELYGNVLGYIMGFGMYSPVSSADYFPVIPWIFLFIAGIMAGEYFERDNINGIFYKNMIPPVTWLGTKTMIIYILHQPIIYGIFELIYVQS